MFIYHITEAITWQNALSRNQYIPQTFDKEGFIHCSLENQVLEVAKRFYSNSTDLVLLKVDPNKLEAPLVLENLEGNAELFPHVYGPLPLASIVQSLPLEKDKNDCWLMPNFS